MTEIGLDSIVNLNGTMYVDLDDNDEVMFFDQLTSKGGPYLGLRDIEDSDFIYQSPTVVTEQAVVVGAEAIRSFFKK